MLEIVDLTLARRGTTYHFEATAKAGQIVLIRGKSGIGKTTLLDCIVGFEVPDRGKVLWQGKDFLPLLPHQRPLSILQQGENLFPHLSLLENVCLAGDLSWRISPKLKKHASILLKRVGLEAEIHQLPEEVSGGQTQRAGLARALLRHQYSPRPILMLDEPYSALDDDNAWEMHQLVERLCQEHQLCVLMVTHREMFHHCCWQLQHQQDTVSLVVQQAN